MMYQKTKLLIVRFAMLSIAMAFGLYLLPSHARAWVVWAFILVCAADGFIFGRRAFQQVAWPPEAEEASKLEPGNRRAPR